MGKLINASEIAAHYSSEIQCLLATSSTNPKPLLVGFLTTTDPGAEQYAHWTSRACAELGIHYSLKRLDKFSLESEIIKANTDDSIHGIIVYYPVFGSSQDNYLQNIVAHEKDVEGMSYFFKYNLYHNIRYLNTEETHKCILPCTPLAIVKALEYMEVYDNTSPIKEEKLKGKIITVINRSEIVGRPLAAMLANDGARVYSVDMNSLQEFYKDPKSFTSTHQTKDLTLELTLENVLPISDVVIAGVPNPDYKLNTVLLKEDVIAINFSSFKNFNEDNILDKASIYLPSIGKITIAMLQRNLLRLYQNKSDF